MREGAANKAQKLLATTSNL